MYSFLNCSMYHGKKSLIFVCKFMENSLNLKRFWEFTPRILQYLWSFIAFWVLSQRHSLSISGFPLSIPCKSFANFLNTISNTIMANINKSSYTIILFKPILINHLYLIVYPSRHKLTSAHLHKQRKLSRLAGLFPFIAKPFSVCEDLSQSRLICIFYITCTKQAERAFWV